MVGPKRSPPHPGGPQGRSWCVVLWSDDDVGRLKSCAGIVAMVSGKEICPTTQREHWQTYVRFESNKRLSWWVSQFPGCHAELRKGTEPQAADYCRKDGAVVVDFGCSVDVEQGADTTEHVLNMLEEGAPLWQVYAAHRKFFFHNHRKIVDMKALLDEWRNHSLDFRPSKRIKAGSSDSSSNVG